MSELDKWCRSPIEVAFLNALAEAYREMPNEPVLFVGLGPRQTVKLGGLSYEMDFCATYGVIVPHPVHTEEQVPMGRIAIELDGHDWHERSKEQAARDRSRDRAFTLAGFIVVRFTGAEVHADARSCVDEVFAIARAWAGVKIPSASEVVTAANGMVTV